MAQLRDTSINGTINVTGGGDIQECDTSKATSIMNQTAVNATMVSYFNNRVHFLQTIIYFDSGKGTISFSAVGCTSRPSLCLASACSVNYSTVVYQWDQSEDEVVLYCYDLSTGRGMGGNVRLQILTIT